MGSKLLEQLEVGLVGVVHHGQLGVGRGLSSEHVQG